MGLFKMSTIIEKIPKMNDQELLVLFHNAANKLSKEPNLAAESVMSAIEHEWPIAQRRKHSIIGSLG